MTSDFSCFASASVALPGPPLLRRRQPRRAADRAGAARAAPGACRPSAARPQAPAPSAPAARTTDEEEEIVVIGQRAARLGDRRHPAGEHARRARHPRDRRDQHHRTAGGDRAADRQRPRARRRRPVMLLNGQRISGFREIRDMPPEAIERVEILPEEVALKYGYSADQRVVNIVLRRRFRSTAARGERRGRDRRRLCRGRGGRLAADASTERPRPTLNAACRGQFGARARASATSRCSRWPTQPPRPIRAPIAPWSDRSARSARSGTANRTDPRQCLGDAQWRTDAPGGPQPVRAADRLAGGARDQPVRDARHDRAARLRRARPLTRDTRSDSGHLGLSLNGTRRSRGASRSTGNGRHRPQHDQQRPRPDISALQARISANDPTVDPLGDADLHRVRARLCADGPQVGGSTARSTAAGDAAGGTRQRHAQGRARHARISTASRPAAAIAAPTSLGRDHAIGSVNVDLPIAKRNGALGAIGQLTLNANAEVEHLSDFGTLTTVGAGAELVAGAAAQLDRQLDARGRRAVDQQLGDPILTTPTYARVRLHHRRDRAGHRDHRRQPGAARRPPQRASSWAPTGSRSRRPICGCAPTSSARDSTNPVPSFPGASAALEAAFPDRFIARWRRAI